MIKAFYQNDIITRLAAIITFGLNEGYSYKSIEEHFVSSPFVYDLENNEYYIESKIEDVVEITYKTKLHKPADISYKGLFFAESYFKLFLCLNRSFQYVFLYLPISLMVEKYSIYHEMDFSNLRKDFESYTKKTTLLRKLSIENQIKLSEISKLTGINENTIDKYSRDDKYLSGASVNTIHRLSKLFGVKKNLFISNLGVYLDQSVYLFDKTNEEYRNYLGFYFANYFDNRINEKYFVYDEKDKSFNSIIDDLKIVVIAKERGLPNIDEINEQYDEKTYLIFFPGVFLTNDMDFEYLKATKCLDVMVITQEYVYIIKKGTKKEITDTINRSLIIRAKDKTKLK